MPLTGIMKPGARIFVRSTSFVGHKSDVLAAAVFVRAVTPMKAREKLLRKKKNESWAMRRFENIRAPNKSDSGGDWNLSLVMPISTP